MSVKPICGSQGELSDDKLIGVLGILSILGGLVSIVQGLVLANTFTFLGVTASIGIWLAGVFAAVAGIVYIGYSWYENCIKDYPGINPACTTGVVNGIVPSFNSIADYAYPFMAMHPRLDVVVKSTHWDMISQNAEYIYCNNDVDTSPMVLTFYHSDRVCAAGLGSTIGAVVGGAGGILLGALVAGLICASVVLSLLCIVALLVAAAIALAGVLGGAEIGGLIALANADSDAPQDNLGNEIQPGDYVSIKGNLALNGNFHNARVYWFANPEETAIYGASTGSAPYSYTDPDTNIPSSFDICFIPQID